jgi:TPR repeat protein
MKSYRDTMACNFCGLQSLLYESVTRALFTRQDLKGPAMRLSRFEFQPRPLFALLLLTLSFHAAACSPDDSAAAANPSPHTADVLLEQAWAESPVTLSRPYARLTACDPFLDDLEKWIELGWVALDTDDLVLKAVVYEAIERLLINGTHGTASQLLNKLRSPWTIQQAQRLRSHREKNVSVYEAAIDGDADAMAALAHEYDDIVPDADRGMYPCEQCAATWYWRSAACGSTEGMVAWGIRLRGGWGIDADPVRAMQLFETAFLRGSTHAGQLLHQAYVLGYGIDWTREIQLHTSLQRQAENDALATTLLGLMHRYGRGTDVDHLKALEAFRSAATAGEAYAMALLGTMISEGLGVERADDKEARAWLHKAQNAGSAWGKHCLAVLVNREGHSAEAIRMEREAANAGDMEAISNLGLAYMLGQQTDLEVAKDDWEAARWNEHGAKLGHAYTMHNLANMYHYGRAVDQCASTAERWYRRSLAAGLQGAIRNLGILLLDNNRQREAYELFEKGHAEGNIKATFFLGLMFERGIHVQHNFATGRRLIVESARAGDPEAQEYLRHAGASW